jgi:hypothetical protein
MGEEMLCGMANLSVGTRRIPATGNAQTRLSWPVKGLCGTFYWSVQAVDTAFAGSPWPQAQAITTPHARFDLDQDCDVDAMDRAGFEACATGPGVSGLPPGCPPAIFDAADADEDDDVDQADFASLQRCYSGEDNSGDPSCAN